MLAAKRGHTETVQALIRDGVDVECQKVRIYIFNNSHRLGFN